jgi:hypothetical protein
MLRIKKEVDLKELEKFGFRKSDRVFKYIYDYTIRTILDYQIRIYEDRHIEISQEAMYDWDYNLQDKLYDLIQANLVEKVEE